jgi:hypothetical protein
MNMRSWWEWIAERPDGETWTLVGKGPSFRRDVPQPSMGLNHVALRMSVTVAHIIDINVLYADPCKWSDCDAIVMPWYPHVSNRPIKSTLLEWSCDVFALDRAREEGRLLWYNCGSADWENLPHVPDSPVVGVRYFSAEAALNLLAGAGVKQVRTAGIDGGRAYHEDFARWQPLTNGQQTFDRQTRELERIARVNGMTVKPLVLPCS